jgi:hypothetical protein
VVDLAGFRSVRVTRGTPATAWVESGATLGELYYAIGKVSDRLAFPAGLCPTVGVGGHLSGGGFGMLLRRHGLAADHVVEALLVNAEGRLLNSTTMGRDVFWAIRGGAGGGSFGIVLSWRVNLGGAGGGSFGIVLWDRACFRTNLIWSSFYRQKILRICCRADWLGMSRPDAELDEATRGGMATGGVNRVFEVARPSICLGGASSNRSGGGASNPANGGAWGGRKARGRCGKLSWQQQLSTAGGRGASTSCRTATSTPSKTPDASRSPSSCSCPYTARPATQPRLLPPFARRRISKSTATPPAPDFSVVSRARGGRCSDAVWWWVPFSSSGARPAALGKAAVPDDLLSWLASSS